jgi:hypothetical protein
MQVHSLTNIGKNYMYEVYLRNYLGCEGYIRKHAKLLILKHIPCK